MKIKRIPNAVDHEAASEAIYSKNKEAFTKSRREFFRIFMISTAGMFIPPQVMRAGQFSKNRSRFTWGNASNKSQSLEIRLYVLDGGKLEFKNMGDFADTGEHSGETGVMAAPVFLIHHGNDWMLWDTGLGDRIADEQNGEEKFGGRFTVKKTIKSQLAELGLSPDDIRYVALSHLHADHSGNIGLFPKSTFIISTTELNWARSKPTPGGVEISSVNNLADDHLELSDADVDVFSDGSVRILKAPGHTPGHRVLLLKLANSGYVLISGDLYHTRENYEKGLIPIGNTDRAATLASFNRFDGIRKNTKARVIIQHSVTDIAALPQFPNYLD